MPVFQKTKYHYFIEILSKHRVYRRLRYVEAFFYLQELNSTQLNEHLWTQVIKHLNVHIYLATISYRYHNQLISRTDLSPIPVRSAAKSYITSWCIKNLSKRVLNRQTVSASTTYRQTIPDINYTCRKRILSCIVVKRMIE